MKTPWHLWVIGIVSLLWNFGGAYDYIMVRTGNQAYLDQMAAAVPGDQAAAYLETLANYPFWVSLAWALGVWGAVAGSVLLLLRSRFAASAFILSFIGMIGNLIYGTLLSPTPMTQMMTAATAIFSLAIIVVSILLILYSRRMAAAGVLR